MKDTTDSAYRPNANMYKLPESTRIGRWTAVFYCSVAILLGIYQAWDTRYSMNADGISYLDMGDAYLRGDWDMAINAYWSPFYSWLLGLAMLVFKPHAYWEFPLVHLVNLLIYLCTLACFHFFMMQLIYYQKYRLTKPSESRYEGYPEWALMAFGYSLFIWTSLSLISVSIVTPDMCVAAFVFLASGILLRIRTGSIQWLTFILLGVILGFSYLAKAIMFPMSFIFLLISLFLVKDFRKGLPRALIALMAFLIVAGPFMSALSLSKGRLTYGDTGKLAYAWYVNSVTKFVHWQGESAISGIPHHPVRKIFDKPAVYEFGAPRGGTYPPWYDPSYWHEGVEIHFDLSEQLHVVMNITHEYFDILFKLQPSLFIGCFILYYMSRRRLLCINDIAEQWSLFLPALAAMGIYALVHVERRFLGAFFVLLWIGAFSGVKLPKSNRSKTLLSCIVVFIAMVIMIGAIYSPLSVAYNHIKTKEIISTHPVSLQVVHALNQMGVRRGDKVAVIGWVENIFWARLAGVQIIADIPLEEKNVFLEAEKSIKAQVFTAFKSTGAKAVVIHKPEEEMQYDDFSLEWKRIVGTSYYIYFLNE